MRRHPRTLRSLAAALPLTLFLYGCVPDEPPAGDASAETEAQPATIERLLVRSAERAASTCQGEWIVVYDYIHPDIKAWMSVYQFLGGKDRHAYSEPTEPRLLARDGETAYVSLTALWTPTIDIPIDNVPEDWDPTERIEWIETWGYADGDWHLRWPAQGPEEFFSEHPELLRKDAAAAGALVPASDVGASGR